MSRYSLVRRSWMAFEPLEQRAMMSIGAGLDELPVENDGEGPFGFDDDTSAYFAAAVQDYKATAAPAGARYLIYDQWGRTWYDAEKRDNPANNAPDNLMCWAATASNVLAWTGWGLVGGLSNTDQIFKYFQDHWTDVAGAAEHGWDWWFDGSSPSQGWKDWSQVDVAGGGFYRSQNFQSYFRSQQNDSQAMQAINEYAHAGYGMGLGIRQGGATGSGHAITCWGYNYNPSRPNEYYGVWVTDSDDDKQQVNAPDSLKYYQVQYVGGQWRLQDYCGSNNWYIDAVAGLAKNPATPWYAMNEIRGTVWYDNNGNGSRESGDRALAGETVYLDLNDNGVCDQGSQTFSREQPRQAHPRSCHGHLDDAGQRNRAVHQRPQRDGEHQPHLRQRPAGLSQESQGHQGGAVQRPERERRQFLEHHARRRGSDSHYQGEGALPGHLPARGTPLHV